MARAKQKATAKTPTKSKVRRKARHPYRHCTNCGSPVVGAIALRAAGPNTIYCRVSDDRLVDGKCPNKECPLSGQHQHTTVLG